MLDKTGSPGVTKISVPAIILGKGTVIFRLALGGIFLWTALAKLDQPYDFLWAVYNYELVGRELGMWIAQTLPWVEFVVGLSLVFGVFERGGLVLGMVFLTVFTFAQISAATRDLKIPCGCGTKTSEIVSYRDPIINGSLLVAAFLSFVSSASAASRRRKGGMNSENIA